MSASPVRKAVARTLVGVTALAVLAGAAFAYLHRQTIEDHFAAERHLASASADLTALANRLQLTDAGKRIFWASAPTLEASQHFNEQCAQVDHSEEGHVLGCYANTRIHLFSITDQRLNGIVEVTAAHELLHAVYARLGDHERTDLARRLRKLYDEFAATDAELVERMSVYADLPEADFVNELHSVLGTEQARLPVWFEDHYARWLKRRSTITEYFANYRTVFQELRQRSEQLQRDIVPLHADIEQRNAAYALAVEQFNSDWARFMQRNDNFEFSDNPDEFYRLRDEFTERRDALNLELQQLNAEIERYEQLREELLQLSELNHELEQQLNSTLAPPAEAPLQAPSDDTAKV